MVYSGTRQPADEDALDAIFAALAHRSRRAALRQVAAGDREGVAMNQLAEQLAMSPQALQKHLASLERAGLIARVREGRVTHARAQPDTLAEAQSWITEMSDYWAAQLDSLGDYIKAIKKER